MPDNPEVPEGEPTGEEPISQDISQSESELSLELTPEQEQVLDQKRKQLLQGDDLCLRFVYHKEYQDLVERGKTNDTKESIMEKIVNLPLQYGGGWNSNSQMLAREHNRPIPGDVNRAWANIADAMTDWHGSSQGLSGEAWFFREYKEIYKECRSKGLGKDEARAMFADSLKSSTSLFVLGVYEAAGGFDKFSTDERIQSAVGLLSKPNEVIPEKDRVRLQELMAKETTEFKKSDIRFLMKYSKGMRVKPPFSDLPYSNLEIWSADVGTGRGFLEEFKLIPEGTKTDKLLAVVVISPSDKESQAEIAEKMVSRTKDNPQSAHLIINARLFEFYPKHGTDFLAEK